MRICVVADPHWSQNSSIVRGRGEVYSQRLENLIQSVNWAENLAAFQQCGAIFYIGDFFDSCQLNSEEISAMREVRWSPISHVFLTGNHETNVGSLEYSTTDIFNLCPNSVVINKPEIYTIDGVSGCEIAFLPYILERDRKSLDEYFGTEILKVIVKQPLTVTNTLGKYDIICKVQGGGFTGQAGAIRHGISRALLEVNEEFRPVLKANGFLTRDPRMKERKKYGLKKARRAPQFSKR